MTLKKGSILCQKMALRSRKPWQPHPLQLPPFLSCTDLTLNCLDQPHIAALKARSSRPFPKLLSPVHTSQESSSGDLTVPCTEEPQQTQLLSQALAEVSGSARDLM